MAGREAERVLKLADSTLAFIRQTPGPELIDLCAEVKSVEFLLAPVIRQKSITLQLESSGDCMAEGNAGEIRQVLLNIIRNACEAVKKDGTTVKVTLTGIASRVLVSVSDQGAGIDAELLPKIFEFGVSTKGEQGNGMGLWTVKWIVNKHRGEVSVHSMAGEGTRVDLWWPRSYMPVVEQEPATARF
jgi:signal transduction histidine kinase